MNTQFHDLTDAIGEPQIAAFFSQDGPLAQCDPQYMVRAGQVAMARAVAKSIAAGGSLVVEAGTGIGKTWAYLVPSLLSGKRILISTATKTLQDQLFGKDLPTVSQLVGRPLRSALLKGRSSYLCLHRLSQAWQRIPPTDRYLAGQLRLVEEWATGTSTGDLSEAHGLDERSEVLPFVTSTRDNCLGQSCPRLNECHVYAARRAAMGADVVVVNHHLFFADWAVRESGVAELLPTVDVAVFDEAHQLKDVVVQFLGQSLSSRQILDWGREVLLCTQVQARGLRDWVDLAADVESAVRGLQATLSSGPLQATRLNWLDSCPDGVSSAAWADVWDRLYEAIEQLFQAVRTVEDVSPDLQRLAERGVGMQERMQAVSAAVAEPVARWVEVAGGHFLLQRFPLDVGASFQQRVLGSNSAIKTWVFTSATLGVDNELSWFTQALGLTGFTSTLRVASPFDYGQQAAAFVPADLPIPAAADHPVALARKIWPWAMRLGGRTLVLTTTLRALSTVGQALRDLSERDLGPEVWVQGDEPKRDLLARFKRAGEGQGPGVVLVASASFWEGVDLPGDCLQMVVIDKLPFPPPDDPWAQARSKALKAAGISPFKAYFLPETAVALRQGAGRLIRTETDQGLLVVGDVRLLTMPYGRKLRSVLPPMNWLDHEDQLHSWLEELVTRASTRGLPWS